MSTLREAAQQALRALKALRLSLLHPDSLSLADASIAALDAALAQQEQGPVAEVVSRPERTGFGRVEDRKDVLFLADLPVGTMLYTHPPCREWVSLTEEEIKALLPGAMRVPPGWRDTVAAIEAALKERNT